MSDVDFMAAHAARVRALREQRGNDDESSLSRSGYTSPYGPLSEGRKIRLPHEIESELDRRAHGAGMSFSEYVRDVLIAHVLGPDEVVRIAAERARRVVGLGSDEGRG